jgi:glycerol-3-phosphate dehydrogenase subunit C
MLRVRAFLKKRDGVPFAHNQLTQTDRNGCVGCALTKPANWVTKCGNKLTRPLMEKALGVDRRAALPPYEPRPVIKKHLQSNETPTPSLNHVLIYATCYGNYHDHAVVESTLYVLKLLGVQASLIYPECCGMPRLEQGDLKTVSQKAARIAKQLRPMVEKGQKIVSLVPSCTLMMKQEWPLLLPDNEDVLGLKDAVVDLSRDLVERMKAQPHKLKPAPLDGPVAFHVACHARAQNQGRPGEDLLRLIPNIDLTIIERCSGHGGSWGIFKENFSEALKVGRPVFRKALETQANYVVSECPLAATHIAQGMAKEAQKNLASLFFGHPIELFARTLGYKGSNHAHPR